MKSTVRSDAFIVTSLVVLCLVEGSVLVKLPSTENSCDCDPIVSNFNETIVDKLDAGCRKTYVFSYQFQENQDWAASVCIKSAAATVHEPLLLSVRQSLEIRSWQVPMTFSDDSLTHQEICHTLCPLSNYYLKTPLPGREQNITLELSTISRTPLSFEMNVSTVNNFILETEQVVQVTLTPSKPHVFQYNMEDTLDAVRIEASSDDDSCMMLSIQDIKCPFYDSARMVEHQGFYQTLTRQSGIFVTRKAFKEGRLYIVLILNPTDIECKDYMPLIPYIAKRKEVTVRVVPTITDEEFYEAVFGAFGFFVLIYIFSFAIGCFIYVRKRRYTEDMQVVDVESPSIQTYGTVSVSSSSEESSQSRPLSTVCRPDSPISIDETDMDKLPDAEQDKNVVRTKTILFVSDLSRKKDKYLSQKTKVYSWNLITIAVFYGLPVVQLVYINQKIVNLTGNQDICYYNFLCSHQIWVFSDFNHVYSNIGYVMLGILFLLLVWRREALNFAFVGSAYRIPQADLTGIPNHYGLMYAMGWALIMEGVLSASYHVCPNKANFQFDTAFMYVIATVCMLKLYQARHPDITAQAHTTWMVLTIVILIGVGGVLRGGLLFWVLFVVAHLVVTFLVSTTIYYMGRWKLDRHIFKRIHQNIKLDIAARSLRPTYLGRFIVLTIAVLFNVALDIYGLVERPDNFAAYLLAVFIMNLLLYLMYYTIMKIRYREGIRWIPLMYIILSFLCWGAALHFFLAKNTSWKVTPAESRERNKHCIILNFFDDHDVWHFLSSCALFFSFMVLFTLDDNLEMTPRSKIIVF